MITARELRDIEAAAAPTTSKAIRKALRDAAEALENGGNPLLTQAESAGKDRFAAVMIDAIALLEEVAGTRISQTMTEHRAAEIVAENNRKLHRLAIQLRGLVA